VLLLEAGGWDWDPLIHVPVGLGKIHEHRLHDWGYDTECSAVRMWTVRSGPSNWARASSRIERRPDLRCGRGFPGRLVMAAGKCTGANAPPVSREAEEDWDRSTRHGAEASPHSR
jgi:hypothetical protein